MKKRALNQPPFPPLKWDKFFWVGEITLPSWSSFHLQRAGDPAPPHVRLTLTPDDARERTPPLVEQIAGFQFLLDHEAEVTASILEALLARYPKMRKTYGHDHAKAAEVMPEVTSVDGFKPLIELAGVHVLNVPREGVSYIGFEYRCKWDFEDGLGVMTHRARAVEVGGADTSFLTWVADEDAESAK